MRCTGLQDRPASPQVNAHDGVFGPHKVQTRDVYWSFSPTAPAIEMVWMGDSDVGRGIGHRSDPVLGADLVFTLVDGRCTARLQGPVTRRQTYPHVPGAEYVGLRFCPGSSESTLGARLHDLQNSSIETRSFGQMDLHRVSDQLLSLNTLAERGEAVAHLLTPDPAARRAPNALVTQALRRFASGNARVANVADELGVSERGLQRCFAQPLGIAPKHAARLVRVSRLLKHLDAQPNSDLAVTAVDAGFFDQAHMTNEIRRVLATTPAALVDERG